MKRRGRWGGGNKWRRRIFFIVMIQEITFKPKNKKTEYGWEISLPISFIYL